MRLRVLMAASAMLLISFVARADSYTLSGIFSPVTSFTIQTNSNPFAQFNPALGTLTSFSIAVSGNGVARNAPSLVFKQPGTFDAILIVDASAPTYTFNASGSTSGFQPDLDAVTGTGTVHFLLQDFRNSSPETINFTSSAVTYTYTPTVVPVGPTPEPSSLALLGTGVLGVIGAARRRFAA